MAYYIELLSKNNIIWTIFIVLCFILSFLLLIFIAIIIKNYFDVYKLVLLIYAIYFPIGAFMGGYYLITTKQWVPKGNLFTISFLYITFLIINLVATKHLIKCLSKKSEYEINRVAKYMLLGDRITKENRKTSFEVCVFLAFYSNIFIGIYTLIGFCSLLVKWIS
jgi:hypothetical protein